MKTKPSDFRLLDGYQKGKVLPKTDLTKDLSMDYSQIIDTYELLIKYIIKN